jgi:integrase
MSSSTRRTLEGVRSQLMATAQQTQLPPFHHINIIEHMRRRLVSGSWKLSSLLTHLRQINMLAMREHLPSPFLTQEIKDLQTGLWRLSLLDPPRQALPLTLEEITRATQRLRQQANLQAAALFALAWVLAGRLGEVIQIPASHLSFHKQALHIRFTVLKGVFGPQLKVVPTSAFTEIVKEWLCQHSTNKPRSLRLFSIAMPTAILLLRVATGNPHLTGHSFRRGALQHANKNKTSGQDLMTLSGHRSEQDLQRYIGGATKERRTRMLRVGRSLLPTVSTEVGHPHF